MGSREQSQLKSHQELSNWDQMGIFLSILCLVHCLATPFVLMSLPILARYYLVHPLVHWVLALFILPVGFYAFAKGYRYHRKTSVLVVGSLGLVLVGLSPLFFDFLVVRNLEPLFVSLGSGLLVYAHWKNYHSCGCAKHQHS